MDVLTNGVLDFTHHEVRKVTVLSLQEANVVRCIDQTIASHLDGELIVHVSLDPMKEVADDLLVLVLHLHVIDLGNDNGMVEAPVALSQSLDDVVEVGPGSLPIRRQVLHFHTHLLSKDVLLNVVVLIRHAAHGPLGSQFSRLLTPHSPLHL